MVIQNYCNKLGSMLNQDSKKVDIFQSWFKSFNVHGLHEYNFSVTGINIERVLLLFNNIEIIKTNGVSEK